MPVPIAARRAAVLQRLLPQGLVALQRHAEAIQLTAAATAARLGLLALVVVEVRQARMVWARTAETLGHLAQVAAVLRIMVALAVMPLLVTAALVGMVGADRAAELYLAALALQEPAAAAAGVIAV